MDLCKLNDEARKKAHQVIDSYADRGLRSLGVARQEIPEGNKESAGGPWQFMGLLPLFDPPRHDSAEIIRRALHLGVNVKMITGDQLAIEKKTGRRLGMGTNMYPSSALLGDKHGGGELIGLNVDDLIEKADGFAGVFPEHKYEIVKRLQDRKHICGMTGDGVNVDAPALKKANIGIAVDDATDAARSASDIVLTEPGLSVIVSAVLTSRSIFQRMKNYTIYAVSITIRIVLGFLLIALIWRFDFSPFMVLIIAILNNDTIMTISEDRVKPSPLPDSWKLGEIFATGIVLGDYQAIMTVVFFYLAHDTDFFPEKFGVRPIRDRPEEMMAALYLQVSIISQALTFVTRSRSWSFVECPGLLLLAAFLAAQLVTQFADPALIFPLILAQPICRPCPAHSVGPVSSATLPALPNHSAGPAQPLCWPCQLSHPVSSATLSALLAQPLSNSVSPATLSALLAQPLSNSVSPATLPALSARHSSAAQPCQLSTALSAQPLSSSVSPATLPALSARHSSAQPCQLNHLDSSATLPLSHSAALPLISCATQ